MPPGRAASWMRTCWAKIECRRFSSSANTVVISCAEAIYWARLFSRAVIVSSRSSFHSVPIPSAVRPIPRPCARRAISTQRLSSP